MWTTFKVFIEFVTTLLLFYILLFWPWGTWDLNSLTRDQTRTSSPEGEVLTTGPPGKSPKLSFNVLSRLKSTITSMTNSGSTWSSKQGSTWIMNLSCSKAILRPRIQLSPLLAIHYSCFLCLLGQFADRSTTSPNPQFSLSLPEEEAGLRAIQTPVSLFRVGSWLLSSVISCFGNDRGLIKLPV